MSGYYLTEEKLFKFKDKYKVRRSDIFIDGIIGTIAILFIIWGLAFSVYNPTYHLIFKGGIISLFIGISIWMAQLHEWQTQRINKIFRILHLHFLQEYWVDFIGYGKIDKESLIRYLKYGILMGLSMLTLSYFSSLALTQSVVPSATYTILLILLIGFIEPYFEEIFFGDMLPVTLYDYISLKKSLLIAGIVYASFHIAAALYVTTPFFLVILAISRMLWTYYDIKLSSRLPGIVAHTTFNLGTILFLLIK